ncbi:helicase, partial [[Kitasatospora] papulosa]
DNPATTWPFSASPPHSAATNDSLASPHRTRSKTVHNGFPLGAWLDRQRQLAKKRSSPSPTQQTLATIDPWWNPPWDILWHRTYHHAQADPRHPTTRQWLQNQRRIWALLHPHQQHLLTTTGLITA